MAAKKRSGASVGGRDPGAAATSRTGKATDCRYKDYDGNLCVSITAVPITKLFARGGGGKWRTCATRDYEPRPM
jgi:hypothetical protein